jgi:hypothetical protein
MTAITKSPEKNDLNDLFLWIAEPNSKWLKTEAEEGSCEEDLRHDGGKALVPQAK